MHERQIRPVSFGNGFGQLDLKCTAATSQAFTLTTTLGAPPPTLGTLAQIEVLKIWLDRRGLPS